MSAPVTPAAEARDRLIEAVAGAISPLALACFRAGVLQDSAPGHPWDQAKGKAAEIVDGPLATALAESTARTEEAERERDEARREADERGALVTAWEHVTGSLEAHLMNRVTMRDCADPERYLSILRSEVKDLPDRSNSIYAATQHRAACGDRKAERAEEVAAAALKRSRLANARADAATARIAALEAALEPVLKFANARVRDDSLCTIHLYGRELRAIAAAIRALPAKTGGGHGE